jgi:hypothetical protein
VISSPGAHACIVARALAESQILQRAGGRQESLRHVFGIEPRLEGVTIDRQLILSERQRLARRHAQLPFHKIEPVIASVTGMLHLKPRVHLHEPEPVGRSPREPSTMNSTVPAPE